MNLHACCWKVDVRILSPCVRCSAKESCPGSVQLRCSHSENNLIEQDHRGIQRRADAKQYLRSFSGAKHTIAGYEAMHMLRKGQIAECRAVTPQDRRGLLIHY